MKQNIYQDILNPYVYKEKRKLTADDDDCFEDSTWGSDEGPGFARPLK